MTDLADRPTRSEPASTPGSPVPARLRQPGWRDRRLIIGLLLVLLSVVIGAAVVRGADQTSPYLAVSSDLSAGHVLTDGDLTVVRSRIPSSATSSRYFAETSRGSVVGQQLVVPVSAGELLGVAAVGTRGTGPTREVSVAVRSSSLALIDGQRVDVLATTKGTGQGGQVTAVVLRDIDVAGSSRGDSAGSTTVTLRVTPEQAVPLVFAANTADLTVIAHGRSGSDEGQIGTGSVSTLPGVNGAPSAGAPTPAKAPTTPASAPPAPTPAAPAAPSSPPAAASPVVPVPAPAPGTG